MTVKVTFYVGLNDKDTHTQKVNSVEATNVISNIFVNSGVEGATISGGQGIYKHDDGTVVVEQTIIIQVYEFGAPVNVPAICDALKTALNQESIAVEKQETNSNLY